MRMAAWVAMSCIRPCTSFLLRYWKPPMTVPARFTSCSRMMRQSRSLVNLTRRVRISVQVRLMEQMKVMVFSRPSRTSSAWMLVFQLATKSTEAGSAASGRESSPMSASSSTVAVVTPWSATTEKRLSLASSDCRRRLM